MQKLADMGSIWSIFLHKFESSLVSIIMMHPYFATTFNHNDTNKCLPEMSALNIFPEKFGIHPSFISLLIRTFKIDLFRHRLQNSDAGSTFPGSTFWEGFLQIIKLRNLILRHLMYYFHAQYTLKEIKDYTIYLFMQ